MTSAKKETAPDPRRVRWSVPQADASVNEWLDLQNSISDSLRLLIRESIQRDGYIDFANRPVDQLPRRGRPVGSGESDQKSDQDSEDDERREDDAAVESVEEESPADASPDSGSDEPDSSPEPASPAKRSGAKGVPEGMGAFLT